MNLHPSDSHSRICHPLYQNHTMQTTTWRRRRRRTLQQAALLCTIVLIAVLAHPLAVDARTHSQPRAHSQYNDTVRGSQNISHTPLQKHQDQILNATTTDRRDSNGDHEKGAHKVDLKRVHPSVQVAAKVLSLVDRRHAVVSNLADADESSAPLWYTIRWIPFGMLAIGLSAVGFMWYRGDCDPCCCLREKIREKIEREDERVATMNPKQPLRASLIAQSSFSETSPLQPGVDTSRWPHASPNAGFTGSNGSSPITPESPYSPLHTHPYAWKSYQNPSLALHPPDDLVTPQQTSRTLVKTIEADKR